MFNLLTTCYLFLGGAGGGALVVLSLLECARACRFLLAASSRLRRMALRLAFPDELRGFVSGRIGLAIRPGAS